jgi:hypothetical protein
MTFIVLLTLLYGFLGGAIKYVDQAYDEKIFPVRTANVLAGIAAIGMAGGMVLDTPFSTTFFAAMLLSLLLARKIDNPAFAVAVVSIVLILVMLSFVCFIKLDIPALALFVVAGFLDEIGDDYAHRHLTNRLAKAVLHYRPLSDLALLGLILFRVFGWTYLAPYYAFTLAYITIAKCGVRRQSFRRVER